MPSHSPKRALLFSLIGSVILGALLGIVIVLRGEWGWFEIRVILTTITIAVASLCGLACDMARAPKSKNLLPKAGLGVTFLGAGMIILGMWSTIESEEYWKTTACACILAVALVHVCLLSIARLASRFSWVYWIAVQVVFGLAILSMGVLVLEIESERLFRLIVVFAIVDAALTLIVPLLHRISRTETGNLNALTTLEERSLADIDMEIHRLEHQVEQLRKLRQELVAEQQVSVPEQLDPTQ